jgi:hypothetical protein
MGNSVLGTTVCAQIGILCHDLQKTADAYAALLGMAYTVAESSVQEIGRTEYLGQPTPARCKQAFFKWGDAGDRADPADMHPSTWRHDWMKRARASTTSPSGSRHGRKDSGP